MLTAAVADDGPGFEPGSVEAMLPESGEGLAGMRDRAESLGGGLAIQSEVGAGTVLTLTLPVGKGEDV